MVSTPSASNTHKEPLSQRMAALCFSVLRVFRFQAIYDRWQGAGAEEKALKLAAQASKKACRRGLQP